MRNCLPYSRIVLLALSLALGSCGRGDEEPAQRQVASTVIIECVPAKVVDASPSIIRVRATKGGQSVADAKIRLGVGAVVRGPFDDTALAGAAGRPAQEELTLNAQGEAETSFSATERADKVALIATNPEGKSASCAIDVARPQKEGAAPAPRLSLDCEPLGHSASGSRHEKVVRVALAGPGGEPHGGSAVELTIVGGRATQRRSGDQPTLPPQGPAGFIVRSGKPIGVLSRSEKGGYSAEQQSIELAADGKLEVSIPPRPLLREIRVKAGNEEAACIWY